MVNLEPLESETTELLGMVGTVEQRPSHTHVHVHLPKSSTDRKLDRIMADLTALSAAVASLVTTDTSVVAALNDLSAKLAAAGNPTDQAAVDAITAQLTTVASDINTAVATDDPATPAPTE